AVLLGEWAVGAHRLHQLARDVGRVAAVDAPRPALPDQEHPEEAALGAPEGAVLRLGRSEHAGPGLRTAGLPAPEALAQHREGARVLDARVPRVSPGGDGRLAGARSSAALQPRPRRRGGRHVLLL